MQTLTRTALREISAPSLTAETKLLEEIHWAQLRLPPVSAFDELNVTVLTGRQCSGKTTMIDRLSRAFPTQPEGIRGMIEALEGAGHGKEWERLLFRILQSGLSQHVTGILEHALSSDPRPLVADRGLGDFLGFLYFGRLAFTGLPDPLQYPVRKYLDLTGSGRAPLFLTGKEKRDFRAEIEQEIVKIKQWAQVVRYHQVLWLAPTKKFVRDGKREELAPARALMGWCLNRGWRDLGYTPQVVPPYTGRIPEREAHIIAAMKLDRA